MALKWSSEFILEGSLRADESPRAHLPLKLLKLPKVPILPCSRKSSPQLPPVPLPPPRCCVQGAGSPSPQHGLMEGMGEAVLWFPGSLFQRHT